MKHIATCISLALVATDGIAQSDYQPLPEGGATWVEHHNGIVGSGGGLCTEIWADFHRAIWFGVDEVHEGQTYHRLLSEDDGYTFCPPNPGDQQAYHVGPMEHIAYRQDTAERKVYVWTLDGAEALLFDFSAEPGDTVTNYLWGGDLLVGSIDTVELANGPHRRWNLAQQNGNQLFPAGTWVEGVGVTLMDSPYWTAGPGFEYVAQLVCFKEGEQIIYTDSTWGEAVCDVSIIMGVSVPPSTPKGISVHPVPARDLVTISGDIPLNGEVRILDGAGRMVMVQQLRNRTINVSGISPGAYSLLIVREDDQLPVFARFIKD